MQRRPPRMVALLGAIALAAPMPSFGAIITAVSATTDMGSGLGTSLANTINGAGLSAFPSLTATYEPTTASNSWVSGGALSGNVTFDLGSTFLLGGFSFWNQNDGGPGSAGSTGIQGVSVEYSLDGGSFAALPGAPSAFARETGLGSTAQSFSFTPVTAHFVRLNILSDYGDTNRVGFAEIAFSSPASAAPEPSSLVIFGLGAMVFAAVRRCSKQA
jgi:large repetitive protein